MWLLLRVITCVCYSSAYKSLMFPGAPPASPMLLLLQLLHAATAVPALEPTIGILTYPVHNASALAESCRSRHDAVCAAARSAHWAGGASYINSAYARWLEMAGARVVPIRYDLDPSAVRALFSQVNGVLFTGGPAKPLDAPAPYFETASLLYSLCAAAKDVPLWGTCLGLQTIACIANGARDVLGDMPVDNYAYPLNFTAAAKQSKLFGGLSSRGRADFEENVTTNWHHFGVSPRDLAATPLVPLATNVALNGREFVSALEGRGDLPVFAVQFHPESVQWDAASGGVPAKTAAAIRSVQYLATTFVERARRNSHRFSSQALEAAALVQQQGKLTQTDASSLYPDNGVYVFS